ncbi:hypothetical protein F5B22DRAFT_606026 [Xylaria bambusicola]|uniref:uncharacterized protein n=1 Tax=Xylaria bambusicola TaxID=326684 RepID=UPI00200784AF|nr:uncharacterized protein F5B22DRAFT_606026 [Xylaria bambusicola]KAI0517049.1 hypothetical protein F5B22DRAFT_606026 [Xylaria bambusicola]
MNTPVPVSRCLRSRRPWPGSFPRNIVTTTSNVEKPQPPSKPIPRTSQRGRPPGKPYPKRTVPRLCPFNAYKATPYKLVTAYSRKLQLGHPMLIRNLPGFLDGQSWIDNEDGQEGSFKVPKASPRNESALGFDLLKNILESAVTGRSQRDSDPTIEPPDPMSMFDTLEAEFKIERASFEGSNPPLLNFNAWLPQSDFKGYSLETIIVELQERFRTKPQPWIPFRAPLVFIRAVHQYNQSQQPASGTPIAGLSGLVVLQTEMTEEFPFPRIIRDVGRSTYRTKSCSIRAGVRPLRNDMRRYKHSTVVIGQLAGYSIVTLIPPNIKLLDGLPLEFHERVPRTWERSTQRFPLGSPNFSLSSKTWTREFESELAASRDIVLATLIPGDGLLVPEGWWYGVRSINHELQLHATVTWFLGRSDLASGDLQEYDRMSYLKLFPPWVRL